VRGFLHGVWLAAVLVHASVDRMDNVRADRCLYSILITVQQLDLRYSQCIGFQSLQFPSDSAVCVCIASEPCRPNLLPSRIAKSVVELTLKTLGTVTVSLVDSPLAEMTVTVGLDMVSLWALAVVSIADLRGGGSRLFRGWCGR
jgi:hypothetical protein